MWAFSHLHLFSLVPFIFIYTILEKNWCKKCWIFIYQHWHWWIQASRLLARNWMGVGFQTSRTGYRRKWSCSVRSSASAMIMISSVGPVLRSLCPKYQESLGDPGCIVPFVPALSSRHLELALQNESATLPPQRFVFGFFFSVLYFFCENHSEPSCSRSVWSNSLKEKLAFSREQKLNFWGGRERPDIICFVLFFTEEAVEQALIPLMFWDVYCCSNLHNSETNQIFFLELQNAKTYYQNTKNGHVHPFWILQSGGADLMQEVQSSRPGSTICSDFLFTSFSCNCVLS